MEIHHSSLSYSHLRGNPQNKASINPDKLISAVAKTELLIKLDQTDNESTDIKQLTDEINSPVKTPKNLRESHALNAYIQENTQPLKNQRSGLISGIDLFV